MGVIRCLKRRWAPGHHNPAYLETDSCTVRRNLEEPRDADTSLANPRAAKPRTTATGSNFAPPPTVKRSLRLADAISMDLGFEHSGTTVEVGRDAIFFRLLRELPDVAIVIDQDGRLQWANHAAERLFGRSLDASIGLSGLELVHPEDLEFALLSLTSVRSKEVGTPIEVRVNTATGWRLTELVGAPVPWLEDGAVVLCLRDITDRRRFELAHDEDSRLRSLVQNSSTVTMLVSPDGVVRSASGALTRVLGHDPEFVEGKPLAELTREEDRPELLAALNRAERGSSAASPVSVRVWLLRSKEREPVPFDLALVNLVDDPTVCGYVVSGHDITTQRLAELELHKALALLKATLDSTADGILVTDEAGGVVTFNGLFIDMWRLPEAVLATGDGATMTSFVRDQLRDPRKFVTRIVEINADHEMASFDVLDFRDGRVFERVTKPQNVDGSFVGRVWSFRDVTDRKRLEERLSHQAFHDSLTGLGNRARFQDRLRHAVERTARTHGRIAVLFIDLDKLKAVNDSFGHRVGDALLQATGTVIVGCLRAVDTVARLGGDEFGVLIEELDGPGDAIRLAVKILSSLRQPMADAALEISTTASIGVALHQPGISGDELLCNADLAMYAAKRRGGNQYAEFRENMHVKESPKR